MKRLLVTLVGFIAISSCLAEPTNIGANPGRDRAIGSCLQSCTRVTKADPLSKEWKMSDNDISSICTCQCERMINLATPQLVSENRGKEKDEIKANKEVQRIAREAQEYCYPKFLQSRNIKIK